MQQEIVWSGIDVSKMSFDASWVDHSSCVEEFNRIPRRRFNRTRRGVRQFISWLDAQRDAPVRVALEATGRYSSELIGWLQDARPELAPAMIHPPQAKHYHRSLGLRNKTDEVDSRSLGLFARDRNPRPYQPPTKEYRELRELKRLRDRLRDDRTRTSLSLQEKPESALVRRMLKKHLRDLNKKITALDKTMDQLIVSHSSLNRDYQLLITIPGVARKTALMVLGEMGDLRRFNRSRQLAAYTGLSPRQNTSGKQSKPTRIHKGGNARVRQALYLPALTACRLSHTPLGRFYRRLVQRGLTKKAAVVAVMRKLLVLMRALLISNRSYDPDYQS